MPPRVFFGYNATSFAHLDLGIFCHSSLQILSSSVGSDGDRRWTSIFKVSPEISDWVEVRALARPLNDIHKGVPNAPSWLCVKVRVIVLLDGESSTQSEVLSTLDQVFIKDISVLCSAFLQP